MRLRNKSIQQRIRGSLKIEFAHQDITSFSGLELFRRYFRLIDLQTRVRQKFRSIGFSSDYSVIQMLMVLFSLWLTGGRRIYHLRWLENDPLVQRLCSLESLPSNRSVSRWLGQFGHDALQALIALNSELVLEKIQEWDLPRVTLDFDGTVLSCGPTIEGAARGYNPQNRHAKSYYPFLCHVAQTGHFLLVHNRPGNVHDSKNGALEKIQAAIEQVRSVLPEAIIEVRLDSAFFQREIVEFLMASGVEYAIKVPMWNSAEFKGKIKTRKRWSRATAKLSYFHDTAFIKSWGRKLNVIFYRKKISDRKKTASFQLDLFSPNDGVYDYEILWTNKTTSAKSTLDFYNGRCAMEKSISELKQEFAFDAVPTQSLQANSAYQQVSVLAHTLVRNFQCDTLQPPARKRNAKRTALFKFLSLKTIRFEIINAAGQILSENRLRMNQNRERESQFQEIDSNLNHLAA